MEAALGPIKERKEAISHNKLGKSRGGRKKHTSGAKRGPYFQGLNGTTESRALPEASLNQSLSAATKEMDCLRRRAARWSRA